VKPSIGIGWMKLLTPSQVLADHSFSLLVIVYCLVIGNGNKGEQYFFFSSLLSQTNL
jgi:hypothetical protein